jgi:hypothetical protein
MCYTAEFGQVENLQKLIHSVVINAEQFAKTVRAKYYATRDMDFRI